MRQHERSKVVGIVVAHPDDETIWAGGTMLVQGSWDMFVLSLCRGGDKDRAPRFFNALEIFGACGAMADLDDGPEQVPLADESVQGEILRLLPRRRLDILITHSPAGEYSRHLRHEEIGRAVDHLWQGGALDAGELWTFAYEDGGGAYLPRPIEGADRYTILSEGAWRKKYRIITQTYGFPPESYEARVAPRAEAFWVRSR